MGGVLEGRSSLRLWSNYRREDVKGKGAKLLKRGRGRNLKGEESGKVMGGTKNGKREHLLHMRQTKGKVINRRGKKQF